MKKVLLIGWKDLTLLFRDRAALILILLAPFALTIGMAFVTGRLSSANSGPSDIPVVLVNQDGGQLGNALVGVFESNELKQLIAPTLSQDASWARRQVDADHAAAAVIIPAGFTNSILPDQGSSSTGPLVEIELYTNPTSPTSSGLVKSIVEAFLNRVEAGRVGGTVAVTQLITSGLIAPQQAAQVGMQLGAEQASASASHPSITVNATTPESGPVKFDVMAFMAPGMALMFLMFATSHGGRTLLAERLQGTLPRLLVSPTPATQVLGGKVFGIFLSGVAQMLILILTSTLLFSLDWGDPLAVFVLILAAAFGATGWGLLITALARTPGQVSAIGSATMLTFSILGGTFIDTGNFPAWFQALSKITPNAWGLDGFNTLALGGRLANITQPVVALLIMGAVLFTLAVVFLGRRSFAQP